MYKFYKSERKKRKRGVTLYELVIVMLLTALISGLVISFSVFLANYIDKASDLNTSVSEVSAARRAVERWFSYFDSADYDFVMVESDTDYTKTLDGEIYTVSAKNVESGESYTVEMYQSEEGRYLLLSYPEEEDVLFYTSNIDSVSFTHLSNSKLYRCVIKSGANEICFLLVSRI